MWVVVQRFDSSNSVTYAGYNYFRACHIAGNFNSACYDMGNAAVWWVPLFKYREWKKQFIKSNIYPY